MHLELYHEISQSEANLINMEDPHSTLDDTLGSESFYFFPALVKIGLSNKTFFNKDYYKYGWCLQRVINI